MSVATMGYATRTAAAAALRDQAKTDSEIAELLGISVKNVKDLFYSAGRVRMDDCGAPAIDSSIRKALPVDIRQALSIEARKRDMPLERLILDVLGIVALDGLVTAILDDGAR